MLIAHEMTAHRSLLIARSSQTSVARSSATLSPWRSGESYLSKDQRETPLTCSTEVNQTLEV